MLWNLFLSIVPLLIQLLLFILLLILAAFISSITNVPGWVIPSFQIFALSGIVLWALFLPNATYLITELNFSHKKASEKVPEYYDIVMVFTLAVTGVINALVSLAFFHFMILIVFDPSRGNIPLASWLIVFVYILASSFAIYLGRVIRVNRWDVLHPVGFVKKVMRHFMQRDHQLTALGYVALFSGILLIAHVMFFNIAYSAIF